MELLRGATHAEISVAGWLYKLNTLQSHCAFCAGFQPSGRRAVAHGPGCKPLRLTPGGTGRLPGASSSSRGSRPIQIPHRGAAAAPIPLRRVSTRQMRGAAGAAAKWLPRARRPGCRISRAQAEAWAHAGLHIPCASGVSGNGDPRVSVGVAFWSAARRSNRMRFCMRALCWRDGVGPITEMRNAATGEPKSGGAGGPVWVGGLHRRTQLLGGVGQVRG